MTTATDIQVGLWPARPIVGESITKRLRSFKRPTPQRQPLIASDANKCARRIGFRLFGTPADIAYTDEEKDRFSDGDYFDAVAGEVVARNLGARTQLPFNWMPEAPLNGKADFGYRDGQSRKVIGEVKSTSTKMFDRQSGVWSNVPAHPKPEWLLQAGMGALCPSIDAYAVHLVLIDSGGEGANRYRVCEWLVPVDELIWLPDTPEITTVREMVYVEVERQKHLLAQVQRGILPERMVPGFGLVEQPPSASESGDPWNCRYCSHQPTCAALASGAIPGFGPVAS